MYDAYGTVTFLDENCTPRVPNESAYDISFTLVAEYRDNETGCYYMDDRYYHPQIGLLAFPIAETPQAPRITPPEATRESPPTYARTRTQQRDSQRHVPCKERENDNLRILR
jgi:hypothetical protein